MRFQGQPVTTGGDVIVAVDGDKVELRAPTSPASSPTVNPGETVTFEIIRDGKHANVELTLGSRPG